MTQEVEVIHPESQEHFITQPGCIPNIPVRSFLQCFSFPGVSLEPGSVWHKLRTQSVFVHMNKAMQEGNTG